MEAGVTTGEIDREVFESREEGEDFDDRGGADEGENEKMGD